VNRASDDGWTPLAIAIDIGHAEAAAALRRLGATVHHRAGFGTVRQLSLLVQV
jgi:ankyrin repeat protein